MYIALHVYMYQIRTPSPRIHPYAMILKWRGVPRSALSTFGGLGAHASPHARQSRKKNAPATKMKIQKTNS